MKNKSKSLKFLNQEIVSALKRVIKEGNFILGPEVARFENELSRYLTAKHAIGVNTGTDALFYALKVLDIGSGDEVITTPFTFSSTADAITMVGARPVFVDIDSRTFNMDPVKIEAAITKKTKAIIPVHLYGQPADMNKILRIARAHKLKVIEDAAQAFGAEYRGQKTGTIGDIGCLSFFPTKVLGALGDGGAILTGNNAWAEKLRLMRVHGAKRMYYEYPFIGVSSRLQTLQAAVLRVKLKYLNQFIRRRRKIASFYYCALKDLSLVVLPYRMARTINSFNHFTIRVKRRRDDLYRFLSENRMPVSIVYPVPLHLLDSYKFLGYKIGDFPEAEKAAGEVISLPIDHELPDIIIKKTAGLIKNF